MKNINELPKIELHCHLDGSVRPQTIIDIALDKGIPLPTYDTNRIANYLQAPIDCESLDDYLKCFDLPLLIMQDEESIRRVTYELLEDSAKENIKYIEIRFGPRLHQRKGLALDKIVESVLEGMMMGEKDFGIKSNLILSCLRHHPVDTVYDVIECGKKYLGKGVVALDLAGAEVDGFVKKYIEPVKLAKDNGFHITIHAGETGSGQNVWDAISYLGAERIGHGVFIKDCDLAYELVKSNGITLEMCPTSNVQTKAVKGYENHPIASFLRDDILVTVNTDNTRVSNTTLGNEINLISNQHQLTIDEYKAIYNNSVKASFADDSIKEYLYTLMV